MFYLSTAEMGSISTELDTVPTTNLQIYSCWARGPCAHLDQVVITLFWSVMCSKVWGWG